MNTAKEKLVKLIEEMSEEEIIKILEFTERLRLKTGTHYAKELTKSKNKTQSNFWDYDLDDYI